MQSRSTVAVWLWLNCSMTKDAATRLAQALPIGLGTYGVCWACLSFVVFALDDGDERRVAGQVTSIAPVLWGEGLEVSVRAALEVAARRGDALARDGLLDFEERGFRSTIFRAVVRRLAVELREGERRSRVASFN
jgi:hypothetical protein